MDPIEATYENGVFVPDATPDGLQSGARVQVRVEQRGSVERLYSLLRSEGVVEELASVKHEVPFDRAEIWERDLR